MISKLKKFTDVFGVEMYFPRYKSITVQATHRSKLLVVSSLPKTSDNIETMFYKMLDVLELEEKDISICRLKDKIQLNQANEDIKDLISRINPNKVIYFQIDEETLNDSVTIKHPKLISSNVQEKKVAYRQLLSLKKELVG